MVVRHRAAAVWLGVALLSACRPTVYDEASVDPAATVTSSATARSTPTPSAAAAAAPFVPPPSPALEAGKALHMRDAKRELRKLYGNAPHTTLYANCRFQQWKLDWASCCYQPADGERKRLEWEHVVPASAFGRQRKAWREGDPQCVSHAGKPYRGRRCARRASEPFQRMEADMHNLQPTIGVINEARAHYPMTILPGEARRFGSCDVEIRDSQIEPRPAARGEVARAYLYMDWRYPKEHLLTKETKAMFQRWEQADPVDDWEHTRNRFIQDKQGIGNPWVR